MITDRRIDAHIAPSVQDFIRTVAPPPDWLQKAWTSAKRSDLDIMTLDEINAEISASRREKKAAAPEVK